MRILFYAINGIGLGHLNRLSIIEKEIKKIRPDAETLFVTNSKASEFIEENQISCIRIPQHTKAILRKDEIESSLSERSHSSLIKGISSYFCPDIMVFDCHYPSDLLDHNKASGIKNVLVLRKIMDSRTNEFIKKSDQELIDLCIVPHEKKELGGYLLRNFSEGFLRKTKVIDPIIRICDGQKSMKASDGFRILATIGGGGYPVENERILSLIKVSVRKAAAELKDHNGKNIKATLVTGPLYTPKIMDTKDPDIRRYLPRFIDHLINADLVISHAGYNSIHEAIYYKKPAIIIPAKRESEDQRERARHYQSINCVELLADPTTKNLSSLIVELVKSEEKRDSMIKSQKKLRLKPGNRDAAELILNTCDPANLFSPPCFEIRNESDLKNEMILELARDRKYLAAIIIIDHSNISKARELTKKALDMGIFQVQLVERRPAKDKSETGNSYWEEKIREALDLGLKKEYYHALVYQSTKNHLSRVLGKKEFDRRKELLIKRDINRIREDIQTILEQDGTLKKYQNHLSNLKELENKRNTLWRKMKSYHTKMDGLKGKQFILLDRSGILNQINTIEMKKFISGTNVDEELKEKMNESQIFEEWEDFERLKQILRQENGNILYNLNLIEQNMLMTKEKVAMLFAGSSRAADLNRMRKKEQKLIETLSQTEHG
jgi:UDP-N-acetylglucosamine--N-acetylmuramyl-(pentapeptide) pyrophosphoryl-undecaprenol N-acetylglucosamine transferase